MAEQPNWEEVAQRARPRTADEPLERPRLFLLWDEVREVCFEEDQPDGRYLHFRASRRTPSKSCLREDSELLLELTEDLYEEALEILRLESILPSDENNP